MSSPWIANLRSVALNVPDLAKAVSFYTDVWRLQIVSRYRGAVYLRGSGPDHHLLALHGGSAQAQIRHVTLRARSVDALALISQACVQAGGAVVSAAAPSPDPAGGQALVIRDQDGRLFQIVHDDAQHPEQSKEPNHVQGSAADSRQNFSPAELNDRPIRLAHTVLNSHDVARAQPFFEQALGFRLIDRTAIMTFLNCNDDHHSIALGISDNNALNHIAFLMPSVDAVMRGGGRMRDAGYPIEWGPGRHGPGNNAFNYFIDPFGVVIEYTAEVEQVDEHYPVRTVAQWKWPAGRVDQWGISAPPSASLRQAQRQVHFVST